MNLTRYFISLTSKLKLQTISQHILGTFGLRITSILLNLLVNFFLAKWLKADGFGTYVYLISIVTFLQVPSTLGIDKLLVREIAIFSSNKQEEDLKDIISWSIQLTILVSNIIGVITALAYWKLPFLGIKGSENPSYYLFIFAAVPFLSLLSINESILKGNKDIILGQISSKFFIPFFLILGIAISRGEDNHYKLTYIALFIYLISSIISTSVSIGLIIRKYKRLKIKWTLLSHKHIKWLKMSVPLMLLTLMQILNVRVDLIMLGIISGSNAVGIYAVVSRLVHQVSIISSVVGTVLLPSIAELYSAGKINELQKILTKFSRICLLLSLIISLFLILYSETILNFFDSSYTKGATSLLILLVGQLINVSVGGVGIILTMTRNEKYLVYSVLLSTILNVILNIILIPKIDITGAALASAISLIAWNLLSYHFVTNKTSLEPSFVGKSL